MHVLDIPALRRFSDSLAIQDENCYFISSVHVCMYVYTCRFGRLHTCVQYIHTHTHTHTHTFFVHIHVYLRISIYIHTYIHKHIHMHTHMHTYVLVCTNAPGQQPGKKARERCTRSGTCKPLCHCKYKSTMRLVGNNCREFHVCKACVCAITRKQAITCMCALGRLPRIHVAVPRQAQVGNHELLFLVLNA